MLNGFSDVSIRTVQEQFYRVGLVMVLSYGVLDTLRQLRTPDSWHLHGIARLPGMTYFAAGWPRRLLVAAFWCGALGFVLRYQPLVATWMMTMTFWALTSLQHSLPWTGYSVEDETGQTTRQIYHHLHLPGLCALAAVAAETLVPLSSVGTALLPMVSGCIAAHYFVSSVTKLRKKGLGWVDRNLFPYFVALLDSCVLGDSGKKRQSPLSQFIGSSSLVGMSLLAGALLLEFGAIFYVVSDGTRAGIGLGLALFHVMCTVVLGITFHENLAILLVFSVPWISCVGALIDGTSLSTIVSAAPTFDAYALGTFGTVVLLSVCLGERLYPFSILAMFTAPLTPQYIVLLCDAQTKQYLPAETIIGGTTSGMSREYTCHRQSGGSDAAFLEQILTRITQVAVEARSRSCHVLLRTIQIDEEGVVRMAERPLAETTPQGAEVVM